MARKRNRQPLAKRLIALLMATMLLAPAPARGHDGADTLAIFLAENPNAVDFNVVYHGTKLYLSASDDNFLVCLSVAQPALQMRLLMSTTKIYLDPTGKKRRRYEVALPSAMDVKEAIEAAMPGMGAPGAMPPTAQQGQAAQQRPDIVPLLAALNAKGATFYANSQAINLNSQRFHIELDRDHELINYYMLLPKDLLLQAKGIGTVWSLGIVSPNNMAGMPPPDGAQQPADGGMAPPPMEPGTDGEEGDIQRLLQSDIRSWTRFSIDDVNNANFKPLTTDEPADTISAQATVCGDSLQLTFTVRPIETQLAFLMQGLTIGAMVSEPFVVSFPHAAMVRNKVARHPNEVKAVLAKQQQPQQVARIDAGNQVVRPDVQPLVAALCDTTATITRCDSTWQTTSFAISVDRDKALMTFTATVPAQWLQERADMLTLSISSAPKTQTGTPEFQGRRLSGEKAPLPGGLGEGMRKGDAEKRTFRKTLSVPISKAP